MPRINQDQDKYANSVKKLFTEIREHRQRTLHIELVSTVAIRTFHPKSNAAFLLTGHGQHFNSVPLVKILQLYIHHVVLHSISTVKVALDIKLIPQVQH